MAPSIQPDEPSATDGDLDAPADELGDDPAETSTVDWSTLPDAVRFRLAELGADALGDLPRVDVPPSLRPVARFAPAKRARLGGPTIIAALRDLAAYRTAVIPWCKDNRAATLDLSGGDVAAAAAAASCSATRARRTTSSWSAGVRATPPCAPNATPRCRAPSGRRPNWAGCAPNSAAQGIADRVYEQREAELDKLRKRLREQGVRLREARDEAAASTPRSSPGSGPRWPPRSPRSPSSATGSATGRSTSGCAPTGPRRTPSTSPGSPPARRGRPTRSGSPCWWRRWTAR